MRQVGAHHSLVLPLHCFCSFNMGYLCPVAFQAARAARAALLPAPYALLRVTPSPGRAAELALWAAGPTCPTDILVSL